MIYAQLNIPSLAEEWAREGQSLFPEEADFVDLPRRITEILREHEIRESKVR